MYWLGGTHHVVGLEGVGLLYVLVGWYSPCSWTGRCMAPLCTGWVVLTM